MSKQAIVTLTINGIKNHDIETNNEIAKWLRRQADWYIINSTKKNLSNRITLRFMLEK